MNKLGLQFLTIVFSLIVYDQGFAQEFREAPGALLPGKVARVITLPDGTTETIISAPDEEAMVRVIEMQLARGSGPIVQVLERLSLNDVSNLVALELTQSQSADLSDLLAEYRDLKDKTTDRESLVSLRVEYGRKLSKILMPEQINNMKLSGFIFKELTKKEGRFANYLKLSKQQQSDIELKCNKVNSEISDFIDEIEEKTKELRERVNKILVEDLNKEQREKLERLTKGSLDEYFQRFKLESLEEQTNLIWH